MQHNITFTRYGFAVVDADSEEEAWELAKTYRASEISWSEDYEATDVQNAD